MRSHLDRRILQMQFPTRHPPSILKRAEIRPNRTARRGFSVMEILVSLILLGALISSVIPGLLKVQTHQVRLQREARLQQVARNVVEGVHSLPVSEISETTQWERWLADWGIDPRYEISLQLETPFSTENGVRLTPLQVRVGDSQLDTDSTRPVQITLTTWLRLPEEPSP